MGREKKSSDLRDRVGVLNFEWLNGFFNTISLAGLDPIQVGSKFNGHSAWDFNLGPNQSEKSNSEATKTCLSHVSVEN